MCITAAKPATKNAAQKKPLAAHSVNVPAAPWTAIKAFPNAMLGSKTAEMSIMCTGNYNCVNAPHLQELPQRLGQAHVLVGEEGCRQALLAGAAGAPDAVHVVVDVGGQVEVDYVRHVRDVQAARRHVGRHQDRRPPRAEAPQRLGAWGTRG